MKMENGTKLYGLNLSKQLEIVKKHISNALLKYSKTHPFSSNTQFFLKMNDKIPFCASSVSLMEIVEISLDKVITIRDAK
jgi:hypothetical protein